MLKRILVSLACLAAVLSLPGCVLDFSPDGKQVAFVWDNDNERPILATANVDGTGFRLLPGTESGAMPSWSPDGKRILFGTFENGLGGAKLFDVAADKTLALRSDLSPVAAWREDGKRFACLNKKADGTAEAVWYDVAEGGVTLRVPLPGLIPYPSKVVWLPGTDDIAFCAQNGKAVDVYTVEAGELKKITTSGDVISMDINRAAKKLVWARKSPNLKYILLSLYAYDLTSRSTVRLPFPNRVPALNPDPRHAPVSIDYVVFSPDGQRIAVLATMPHLLAPKGPELRSEACYSMRTDGTDVHLVRELPKEQAGEPPSLLPYFSRDGKQLALMSITNRELNLALFNADGTGGKVLKTAARK